MANVDDTTIVSGSFSNINNEVEIDVAGYASLMIQLGTDQGVELPATIEITASVNGTNFVCPSGAADLLLLDGNPYIILNNSGLYSLPVAGLSKVKLSSGSYDGASGAIVVSMRTSKSASIVLSNQSIVNSRSI